MRNRGFGKLLQEGAGENVTEQVLGTPVQNNMLVNRHKARMVAIAELMPDRTQPRRPMPVWLRTQWDGRAETVQEAFRVWWDAAQQELGRVIDIETYLFTDHELEETNPDEGEDEEMPTYRKLMRLINLAYDIARRGLDTPIEVANGIIIYGERRWLAFQLLHWFRPDSTEWQQMPAIVSKEFDVWKQAAENGVHEPLNAIGIARMFAKLVMDIYGGSLFQPYEALAASGATDRAFYAQVAEGNKFPIPSGRVQDVLTVLGLKHPSQLRQYRALLRLRDDVWMRADDEDRTENFLRLALKLQDQIKDLDELFRKLGVTTVTPNSAPPPSPGRPTIKQKNIDSAEEFRDTLLKMKQKGDPEARKRAEDLREWLDKFITTLDL